MSGLEGAPAQALALVWHGDPELFGIVRLSLTVSLAAVAVAALVALPSGAFLALARFPGRGLVVAVLNAAMGLPPVVVGLFLYLLLSRAGPLGSWGLLFTPTAMIAAQAVLVLPIIAALTRQTVADLLAEYAETFRSFDIGLVRAALTLLWDARFSLVTAMLAGFGRAAAEVGAIILVGGNIQHHTRTMTTAIVLETSKGDLGLALGLGTILLAIILAVNATAGLVAAIGARWQGATA